MRFTNIRCVTEGDAWEMWEASTSAAETESYGRWRRQSSGQETVCESDHATLK